ncbi:MAG: hypothetical protein QXU11_06870 [Thermoproteota archaeon]
MSIVKTVLKLGAILLSGSLVKSLLDSIGHSLGLNLGGLTSLARKDCPDLSTGG